MRYVLLSSGNASDLSDEVTDRLEKGWQLYGSPMVVPETKETYADLLPGNDTRRGLKCSSGSYSR